MDFLETSTLVVLLFILLMIITTMIIINGIGLFGYFKVTGYQNKAWKAFIPYLNYHQILILAGMNPSLVIAILLLPVIPFLGAFFALYLVISAYYKMYTKYSGPDKALIATLFTLIPFASLIYHLLVLNKPENIINTVQEHDEYYNDIIE